MKSQIPQKKIVGPGFHQRVYDIVSQVPFGRVASYGDIATRLGSPRVARHVGWALSALTDNHSDVPWHRVINSRGRISVKGQTPRAVLQKHLLESEGVVFSPRGVINMKTYRWIDFV